MSSDPPRPIHFRKVCGKTINMPPGWHSDSKLAASKVDYIHLIVVLLSVKDVQVYVLEDMTIDDLSFVTSRKKDQERAKEYQTKLAGKQSFNRHLARKRRNGCTRWRRT